MSCKGQRTRETPNTGLRGTAVRLVSPLFDGFDVGVVGVELVGWKLFGIEASFTLPRSVTLGSVLSANGAINEIRRAATYELLDSPAP